MEIERFSWAPWLAVRPETISSRLIVFPEGQFGFYTPEGELVAFLFTNRVQYQPQLGNIPTWDEIAAPDGTFKDSFTPYGNALSLVSISLDPDKGRGRQLPKHFIQSALGYCRDNHIGTLFGPFRPTSFGEYKKSLFEENRYAGVNAVHTEIFTEYCTTIRPSDQRPIDPWLRSLSYFNPIRVGLIPNSMVVSVTLAEFEAFQNDQSRTWFSPQENIWECGEAGYWQIHADGTAQYQEPNYLMYFKVSDTETD